MVGFNDVPIAAQLTIPLSSVRDPVHEVGAQGVDLLVRMMRGEPPGRITLPSNRGYASPVRSRTPAADGSRQALPPVINATSASR